MQKLGIWAIAIVGAFLIGAFTANPIVEAQGGWKAAFQPLDDQVIARANSMMFTPGGTGMFQIECEDDEVMLQNGRSANYIPEPARVPAPGVVFDPISRDDLGGNARAFGPDHGIKVTVFDNNEFAEDTTIELLIACANPDFLNPALFN